MAWNLRRVSITAVSSPPYPTLRFNGVPTRLLGINASLVFSRCASCLCKYECVSVCIRNLPFILTMLCWQSSSVKALSTVIILVPPPLRGTPTKETCASTRSPVLNFVGSILLYMTNGLSIIFSGTQQMNIYFSWFSSSKYRSKCFTSFSSECIKSPTAISASNPFGSTKW